MTKKFSQAGISRDLLLIGLAAFVVIAIIVGLLGRGDKNIGVGTEYSDPSGPALISGSTELYNQVGGGLAFETLKTNLAYFARQTLDQYKDGKQADVVFTVDPKSVRTEGKKVNFTGNFAASKDKIIVGLQTLGYGKFKLSVVNSKTSQNIDNQLPTNAQADQFIGSLPFYSEQYQIEYTPATNSYTVTALNSDPAIEQVATDYIANGLGKNAAEIKVLFIPFFEDLGHEEQ